MKVEWERKIHLVLTIMWILAIPPTLIWLSESIPWLVFMSIWANVAGHWSSYQGAKAEQKIGDSSDTNTVSD